MPHVWLDDATPIQDRISNTGYTLLCLDDRHDTAGLQNAFRERAVPFDVLCIASEPARAIYEKDLILLRPDMHVVWRGNSPPEDPLTSQRWRAATKARAGAVSLLLSVPSARIDIKIRAAAGCS